MDFALAIIANLFSAGLGATLAFGYERFVRVRRARMARWFWNRNGAKSVQIFLGTRSELLASEPGEKFLTVSDAHVLGRLTAVLEEFYGSIRVVDSPEEIDWSQPVVSIGGGNSNRVFQNIDISDFPDFRFDSSDHYTIVNRDGSQRSSSIEPKVGQSSSSYAIVGRYSVRGESGRTDLVVIAGAYGPSTLRALVHVLEKENLRDIFDFAENAISFQALVRVIQDTEGRFRTELSSMCEMESLPRQLILDPKPRHDVPESTAAAARNHQESPQSKS